MSVEAPPDDVTGVQVKWLEKCQGMRITARSPGEGKGRKKPEDGADCGQRRGGMGGRFEG